MTPERLAELRSKVKHGYNLTNPEAREVFEHFGVKIEQRTRCQLCAGEGLITWSSQNVGYFTQPCQQCNGTGYEVTR